MQDPPPLARLCARRWAVPILADLEGSKGCKFVTLAAHLDGSRAALKASLGLLETLGLVIPNPGHGHPMRPEYVLTQRGALLTGPAKSLVRALDKTQALEFGLRKWSMPMVHVIHSGQERFGGIAEALGPVTDRAVSLALTDLQDNGWVKRKLFNDRPPRSIYSVARKAQRFAPMLTDLGLALE
ncbi:MAG: hypothetical protein GY930_07165 [bacterium]|nr:hypothetical protein [bacterium]